MCFHIWPFLRWNFQRGARTDVLSCTKASGQLFCITIQLFWIYYVVPQTRVGFWSAEPGLLKDTMSPEYLRLEDLKLFNQSWYGRNLLKTLTQKISRTLGKWCFPSLPFLLAAFFIPGILIGRKYCKGPQSSKKSVGLEAMKSTSHLHPPSCLHYVEENFKIGIKTLQTHIQLMLFILLILAVVRITRR